jgi:hypothetical protein
LRSVDAQVSLNRLARPGHGVATIGLIEVFYEEIFAALVSKSF